MVIAHNSLSNYKVNGVWIYRVKESYNRQKCLNVAWTPDVGIYDPCAKSNG